MATMPVHAPRSHLAKVTPSPWTIVRQAAAALAASMGIGRFVYTPILPLMHAQAGLSATAGAALATANYAGYLVGAVLVSTVPTLTRSVTALRAGLLLGAVSLAIMPATGDQQTWLVVRFVAGAASAVVFVSAVSMALSHLRHHPHHLLGWTFGGVGAGIALSGATVLAAGTSSSWRTCWWLAAALAAGAAAIAWGLVPTSSSTAFSDEGPSDDEPRATAGSEAQRTAGPRTGRRFAALLTSYTLEGVGYIIAGTFLVAAVSENSAAANGSEVWIVVGLAAIPACAAWGFLARFWSRPTLLVTALLSQAFGIALAALAGGVLAALGSAILFGATFLAVGLLTLGIGAEQKVPRAVALLTTGYSAGQVLGPLAAAPLLTGGYAPALLLAAVLVVGAAVAAAVLRWEVGSELRAPNQRSAIRRDGWPPSRPTLCGPGCRTQPSIRAAADRSAQR